MSFHNFIFGKNAPASFEELFDDGIKTSLRKSRILPVSSGLFRSGERFVELFHGEETNFEKNKADLKDAPVTIVQSLSGNVDAACMELFATVRTAKRYGAGDITVVMPFAAFGRQDREFEERFTSVMGDDFPFLLKAAGATKIITADVHSDAAEKFYVDHFGAGNVSFVSANDLFVDHIVLGIMCPSSNLNDVVVGAPDGADKPHDKGQSRMRDLAGRCMVRTFSFKKTHTGVNTTKCELVSGDVKDKRAVLIDDMSDSGGTLRNAARVLKEKGAKEVHACLAHALLDKESLKGLLADTFNRSAGVEEPVIDTLVVTDTVPGFQAIVDEVVAENEDFEDRVQILPMAQSFLRPIFGI